MLGMVSGSSGKFLAPSRCWLSGGGVFFASKGRNSGPLFTRRADGVGDGGWRILMWRRNVGLATSVNSKSPPPGRLGVLATIGLSLIHFRR